MKQLFIPAADIINAVNANKAEFECLTKVEPFSIIIKENMLFDVANDEVKLDDEQTMTMFDLIDWLAEWTHPQLAVWKAQNALDETDGNYQPIIDKELIQTLINLAQDGVKLRNLRERTITADTMKKIRQILKELEA